MALPWDSATFGLDIFGATFKHRVPRLARMAWKIQHLNLRESRFVNRRLELRRMPVAQG
jgi:hypothetical protein